jgi:hypothetical protein
MRDPWPYLARGIVHCDKTAPVPPFERQETKINGRGLS